MAPIHNIMYATPRNAMYQVLHAHAGQSTPNTVSNTPSTMPFHYGRLRSQPSAAFMQERREYSETAFPSPQWSFRVCLTSFELIFNLSLNSPRTNIPLATCRNTLCIRPPCQKRRASSMFNLSRLSDDDRRSMRYLLIRTRGVQIYHLIWSRMTIIYTILTQSVTGDMIMTHS